MASSLTISESTSTGANNRLPKFRTVSASAVQRLERHTLNDRSWPKGAFVHKSYRHRAALPAKEVIARHLSEEGFLEWDHAIDPAKELIKASDGMPLWAKEMASARLILPMCGGLSSSLSSRF